MDIYEMKKTIYRILSEMGIYIGDIDVNEDFDLRELLLDSLQFITMIIEIENSLNTIIPDELLLYDKLTSINAFCNDILTNINSSYP